ncbi:hypothetical protein Mgra_00000117 [Meloidogyne graminicola]|uniref:Secreted protein n=1 Tax=Meloidogyne graminicola TaxID=189291 RepID=A0A8T0A4Q1_9BILA|nr:hypothetical protein Mgra_00000117 [Meloidogyne graminicola]
MTFKLFILTFILLIFNRKLICLEFAIDGTDLFTSNNANFRSNNLKLGNKIQQTIKPPPLKKNKIELIKYSKQRLIDKPWARRSAAIWFDI